MALTRQEVEQIANLARLDLSDEQIALYQEQLSAILVYADRLNELNLDGVEPTTQPVPLTNVMRADVIESALPTEKALANAPQRASNQFGIQAVLEE